MSFLRSGIKSVNPINTLWIIRHGDAEERSRDGEDINRDLKASAHQDWGIMKPWLVSMPTEPEWVFSSPALRTLQTAELISTYFNSELIIDNNLYLATADTLIDRIRSTPEDIYNLALVAHNPGVSILASSLAQMNAAMVLPTWGIAHCQFDSPWHTFSEHTNAKVSLANPKLIKTKTD